MTPEVELAQIWAELLGTAPAGVQDDFFASGGDSIQAAALLARARVRTGAALELGAFVQAPTIAALAGQIRAALAGTGGHAIADGPAALDPGQAASTSPCSFAQERFWFIDQASGGNVVSNVSWALRLRGRLDVPALERAFTALAGRHQSLRTRFEVQDGQPVQVVEPIVGLELTVREVAGEPELTRLAAQAAQASFDLTRGPLLRAQLLALGAQEHVIQFVAHHIICDDWSKGVIMSELGVLYAAISAGEAAALPPPAIQYPAYSRWQRERLGDELLRAELAHWQDTLAGAAPALELATDRPRPPSPSLRGARLRTTIPPPLVDALRELGREAGATFFMTMLAAFEALLHRYTGQEEIVVGTAIDNRGRVELERAIGLFTNVLALRADLSGSPSFRGLLAGARARTLDAVAHQELPFDRLAANAPQRDASRHPIFQAFYEFIVPAPLELPLPGVDAEPFEVPKHTSEFDLGLYLDEQGGGLDAVWEYSTDLFDAPTIERMARHFIALLGALVTEPGRPIAELELLDENDRRLALIEWNATAAPVPAACIHELFEAQAIRRPDAPALVAGGAELSYAQLDSAANRIARRLGELGVRPGESVGLSLGRSTDLIAALLGVLKAGGAYVPLNPDHPPARLAQQLATASARVLLTERALGGELPGYSGEVIFLDEPDTRDRLAAQPPGAPPCSATPDDTAYVLFTSGSTGVPKGVAVRHRNLVNYTAHMLGVVAASSEPDSDPAATALHFASVSAVSTDLGNTAIFPSLAGGGCLHLVGTDVVTDAGRFADYVAEHPIDVLKITPSHLSSLLDADAEPSIMARRLLVLGGEALTWELAARVSRPDGPQVLNHYGPTEATVGCCTFEIHPGAPRPPSATVPIGRPISNLRAYVLDSSGRPAPVGVPGELCIGGAGVAAGYVDAPAETQRAFAEDPFSGEPRARLYRTGDLARHLPDGNLEFLGRADEQVKIRGFRVEPAEVQAVLIRDPDVRQAAVAAAGEGEAKRLVAYVVAASDEVSAAALLSTLEQTLPAYMVPGSLVLLDRLPLTSNGKLDRAALPSPAAPEPSPADAAALTDVQTQLVAIWSELLEHEVTVDQNFFEVGGHSLLAIRLIARLRKELGVKLSLKALIDAPTVRNLAEKVEAARGGAGQPPAAAEEPLPALARVSRDRPLRCSFAQEQLWLVDRLTPGSAAYNFSWPLRLHGGLDADALARAVSELVRRHEALRTRFTAQDGQPMQIVEDSTVVMLSVVDVSAEPDPELAARRLIDEQTQTPFDLSTGPLLRVTLLRLGGDVHVLQIVVHHIVFDGVSKVVLYRDLGALYAAFASGRPSPLPEPAVQYADYAEWERSWLAGERLDRELAHWRAQLEGMPFVLELPTDRPRPPVASQRGARLRKAFPRDLREALEGLARAEGATFFVAVLAAFDVLLYRYTGQADVVVGAPVDTRGRPELEEVVGPFINAIVLRNDVSGSPSFRELVRRVHRRTLDAVEHKELPFERLVEALAPERDLSRHPLFQTLLALNPPETGLDLPGVKVEEIDPAWSAARVDLFLVLDDLAHGLEAIWEYSTDLFDAATIERMAEHFQRLLEAIVADPDLPIDRLGLLTQSERSRLTSGWNQTDAAIPERRLEVLIAEQAARTPGQVAVACEAATLTFAELDARANQLAHRLGALGVREHDLVGVCLPRSERLLVALLGTMKAGAAYVPIDPTYPPERQRFMLEDAQVRVLITEADVLPGPGADGAGGAGGPEVLFLDRDRDQLDAEPVDPPEPRGDPDGLAYVIYTSGSTGRPKGVEIQHRALVNFLTTMRERPGIEPDDVLVAVTTLSFDIAGLELYLPLIAGARVVIAPAQTTSDPRALAQLLQRSGATVMQATPTTWRMLLDGGWTGRPGLRALCGGEALAPGLADQLVACGVELWNMYGPTETTIWSTVQLIRTEGEPPSIGRPIANTSLFILDGCGEPAPIGVPGELHIGGAGLARGYRNRPELTAERFVADPFAARSGARLYKTGDLARYRSDGTVEFLGRLDQQVKLRGYRIELGEIEARLAEHPRVAAAAAAVHLGSAGEPELVAYVVPSAEPVDAEELWQRLGQSLPAYMVPSSLVTLPALPLTPNGKLDRNALPAPEAGGAGPRSAYVAPRTDPERAIAELWSEVLGVERIGVHDDFFELGGQSLLAARLMGRLDSRLGVELPLRALFESPTVAGLAARVPALPAAVDPGLSAAVDTVTATTESPPLVPMARVRRASFAQERFWFIDQVAGSSGAYNISWPVRLRGGLDVASLQRALSEIVRRHEVLRTRFAAEEGRPMQVIDAPGAVTLELIDLSRQADPEDRARRVVDQQTQAPFDVAQGSPLRALLIRLGSEDHILQIVIHHIAADGWSKAVLFGELGALYPAFADDRPSPLPELPVQYGDFAEWQRSWLQGERLERELAYWTAQLRGAPTVLELPSDRPRPAVASLRGAWLRTAVPGALIERLGALGRDGGATLFMVMLAGFEVLLYRYTGQTDVVIGAPVDTRSRAELEQLIGPFVNTIVLRNDLSGSPSFRELLGSVRGRTLDAIEHQELPFERLVEALAPERDLTRHPIIQALLALNPPDPKIALAALEAEELETAKAASRVDLTLLLQQQQDGFDAVFEYSTDLFDAETIEEMAHHFLRLLEAIVADPDRPIDELSLLEDPERAKLLSAFADHTRPFDVALLHERFESQARRTPDAVAVVHEHQTLSYRELNERANRLAHHLRETAVGAETLVALCLERSLDLVISILAVLKAGGAYVPLDPAYPADRLAFVLGDCQAPVLITQESLLERLPEHRARVVCVDRDAPLVEPQSPENLEPLAGPESLAYVIYTSGSTGQPKGVLVEHRNVARLFSATDAWFRPCAADTWTLLHSYAFDFSVWELWGALLHGGRLVVVPAWTARAPEALAALLAQERVTVLNVTPSLFLTALDELLARAGELALRLVIFGGEALSPRRLRPWFERMGERHPQLVNMYGITETTVHVTYRPLSAADVEQDRSPIGVPIPDLQLYLLDAKLSPVPAGVSGELFVGGAGVARGYLNRPELTAERFLSNPFGPGRLYRTGDRARLLRGHELAFEGRIDDQVKIRGFRIELGEIQAVLDEHDSVAEAVVVAHTVADGDTRLAAYVVGNGAPRTDGRLESELRAWLRSKLPEYMVPASFTVLAELPLTANGKLDRRALPGPEPDQAALAPVLPRTPTQEVVAGLWQELLGTAKFGLEDDFFELGGHSLLAAQLAARIRARYALKFSVRAVFEAPTVEGIAWRIDAELTAADVPAAASPDGAAAPAIPIQPRRPGEPWPLSYSQQQLWLIDQWDPGAPTYSVSLPFRIRGPLDLSALGAAVAGLLQRHEVLRTVITVENDQPVPVLLDDPPLELETIDVSHRGAAEGESEALRLIGELARRPFDFARDVLLRAWALRLAEDDHVVMLQTHHIAFDGWSERLLLGELAALYEGRQLPLPSLQFGDYARWQRDCLEGGELAAELGFWRRQLAGARTSIELPVDHPRPEGRRFRGASHDIELDRGAAEALAALCRRENVTPYILMLAALATMLYRITGQDDVLIGSPVANRPTIELESLIGFVSNTLVFRAQLGGDPTFRELLGRVREMALDVYAHQGVPFEKLVEAVAPAREPGLNPLFQVNLRVSGSQRATLELPGLEITPLRVDSGLTRFDLALDVDVLEEGISGYFRYNREIFEPATIARLAEEFACLLRAALASPDRRLLSFELVGAWDSPPRATAGPSGPALRNFRGHTRTDAPVSPIAKP